MKVSLFVTCLSDLLFPKVGKSVVEVLEKLGCEVSFLPDQTCCGQVSFNSGYWNDAKKAAKHFIEVFEKEESVYFRTCIL
ncbi:(Fe-S)-binding protein [Bacillus sp. FJAT-47783]|uniref:(Fe-S)-binding protein n=1 Tax=Bacillus sp. FJAT-47783 TaxID=2922712 RepID=UPI00325FC20C